MRGRERHSLSGFQEPTANPRMPRGARVHIASHGCLSNEATSSSFSADAVRCGAPWRPWLVHGDRPDERGGLILAVFQTVGQVATYGAPIHRESSASRALGKQKIRGDYLTGSGMIALFKHSRFGGSSHRSWCYFLTYTQIEVSILLSIRYKNATFLHLYLINHFAIWQFLIILLEQ